jgi:sugar/nucleoside kinase (ribokinase family)
MPGGEVTAPLLVAGNFSIDETVSPDGATSTAPGGDALYSALGAAIWRYPVGILSRVGRDYPRQLWDQLRDWGVDAAGLVVDGDETVRYRIRNRPDGSRVYTHLNDPALLATMSPRGRELDAVAGAAWLHVAAMPIEQQAEAVGAARRHGVGFSLDPHEEYIAGYEDQVYALARGGMLMPSLLELDRLLPELAGLPDLERAGRGAAALLARGAQAVVVKCGAAGSFVAAAGLASRVPAQRLDRVVDTTGAGDAYAGGFLAGYLRSTRLTWGAVCGSLSAAHVIRGFGALHSPLPEERELRAQAAQLAARIPGPPPRDGVMAGIRFPVTTGAPHPGGARMAVFGERILRCSDGHLFTSSESSRLFGSIHLGPFRRMQCPVDGKIVMCGNVREASLTPEQLEEARRFRT